MVGLCKSKTSLYLMTPVNLPIVFQSEILVLFIFSHRTYEILCSITFWEIPEGIVTMYRIQQTTYFFLFISFIVS